MNMGGRVKAPMGLLKRVEEGDRVAINLFTLCGRPLPSALGADVSAAIDEYVALHDRLSVMADEIAGLADRIRSSVG